MWKFLATAAVLISLSVAVLGCAEEGSPPTLTANDVATIGEVAAKTADEQKVLFEQLRKDAEERGDAKQASLFSQVIVGINTGKTVLQAIQTAVVVDENGNVDPIATAGQGLLTWGSLIPAGGGAVATGIGALLTLVSRIRTATATARRNEAAARSQTNLMDRVRLAVPAAAAWMKENKTEIQTKILTPTANEIIASERMT